MQRKLLGITSVDFDTTGLQSSDTRENMETQ
jgi:hypothetical protein